jgi:hypothetical protein
MEALGLPLLRLFHKIARSRCKYWVYPMKMFFHATPKEIFHHYGLDYEGIYSAALNLLKIK